MSIQAQQRMATRLTFGTALLVAAALLLVGWTFYRPQSEGRLESAMERSEP
jgi:hypothetical protein